MLCEESCIFKDLHWDLLTLSVKNILNKVLPIVPSLTDVYWKDHFHFTQKKETTTSPMLLLGLWTWERENQCLHFPTLILSYFIVIDCALGYITVTIPIQTSLHFAWEIQSLLLPSLGYMKPNPTLPGNKPYSYFALQKGKALFGTAYSNFA